MAGFDPELLAADFVLAGAQAHLLERLYPKSGFDYGDKLAIDLLEKHRFAYTFQGGSGVGIGVPVSKS